MTLDSAFFWAFLLVFVRCSAMLLSSPVFGAQTTPVAVRVMTTLALAGALTTAIRPELGPPPEGLTDFVAAIGNEILCGLLIGMFVSLAFSAFQIAGALLDLQIGLSTSQVVNPATGVPSTLLSQYKHLLALVVFFAMSGHHLVFRAFMDSYKAMPVFGESAMAAAQTGLVDLLTGTSLLALQIAAPVAAVGLVVDVAMGIVNRAVPQMPVFFVGMPAKVAMGLAALGIALPVAAASTSSAVELATDALGRVFRAGG